MTLVDNECARGEEEKQKEVENGAANGEEEKLEELQSEETDKGSLILHDKTGAGEDDEEEWEEEYVILELDGIFHGAPITTFAYTLSGLDTLNPTLTLDNGLKLIGEYTETIGTVVVYSEKENEVLQTESDTQELPTPADSISGNNEKKGLKRIRGVCKLERKLKFCAMPVEDASPQNAMPMEDVSLKKARAMEKNISLKNSIPMEYASVQNAVPAEAPSLDFAMPSENAPFQCTKPVEVAALENAMPCHALFQNFKGAGAAAIDFGMPSENADLEKAKPAGAVALENEDASFQNAKPTGCST